MELQAEKLKPCWNRKIPLYFLKDLAARRFIGSKRWENFLSSNHLSLNSTINLENIHAPGPLAWKNWQQASNRVFSAALAREPLSLKIISEWNESLLQRITPPYHQAGKLRHYNNFVEYLFLSRNGIPKPNERPYSLITQEDVAEYKAFRLPGISVSPLSWDPIVCYENLGTFKLPGIRPECIQAWANAHSKYTQQNRDDAEAMDQNLMVDHWYRDLCWPRLDRKIAHQTSEVCGFVHLLPHELVESALELLIAHVNHEIDTTPDPVALAAETQRQFIAIHPFVDANGRTSRLLMDYIALRRNLPPIYILDTSNNLATPTSQLIKDGYNSVAQAIGIMEACLNLYEKACLDPNVSERTTKLIF